MRYEKYSYHKFVNIPFANNNRPKHYKGLVDYAQVIVRLIRFHDPPQGVRGFFRNI